MHHPATHLLLVNPNLRKLAATHLQNDEAHFSEKGKSLIEKHFGTLRLQS